MTRCPACGAANSIKRTTCFQCEADLCASAPAARGTSDPRVCKNCVHSTVFPPIGTTIGGFEVWCLLLKTAKEADNPAPECFEIAFAWGREESLD